MDEEKDLEYDLLTLIDDEGVEHEFELVDTVEHNDNEYVALVPIYNSAGEMLEDSGELIIMKVAEEGGEQFLDAIEDDQEYVEISDIMVERLSEHFDFDDEEAVEDED